VLTEIIETIPEEVEPSRRMPTSKSDAINVLNTDTAQLYTHIHPFLVLSAYFFNFTSIVTDPVSSLSTFLIPLSILQVAYVILCLPATGSSPSVVPKGSGQKKSSKSRTEGLSSKITVRTRTVSYAPLIMIFSLTARIASIHFPNPLSVHWDATTFYLPNPFRRAFDNTHLTHSTVRRPCLIADSTPLNIRLRPRYE
jgi:hypothetical protein